MSIGGFGARPTQFGGLPEEADASPTDAATTDAVTATSAAQQTDAGTAAAQTASSQTAPASTANGQAMDVWQALQKDPQAQLLQEDLLLEAGAGALEDGVPARNDDEVLGDLDLVWDNQDALYDELDQLTEGTGASSVEGLTPTEVEERMAEIQEELDFLYEYEDLLFDELADPDLDFFESFWTEWDLWDVKFDIADLESELADLQGTVLDWSFDDLWSGFAEGVGNVIDIVFNYYDREATATDETTSASAEGQIRSGRKQDRIAKELRGAQAQRQGAARDNQARVQRTRAEHTNPSQSPKLEARLRGVRKLAADLEAGPTQQAKNRLRVAQRLVRGRRP